MLKKRVLCVDDVGDDCKLFSLVLSQDGYEIETAQSIVDALQLIENSQFDLYLFDIFLRDGTGFELLKKVREIDPSVPVVFCTADVRESTRELAWQAGVQAFLTKPVSIEHLAEVITAQLHFLTSIDISIPVE